MKNIGPVTIVFASSYYDMPLAGLARYNGEVHWFTGDYDTGTYTLYTLSDQDRDAELAAMKKFEEEVGTHWSYEIPIEERMQHPREKQKAYYEAKGDLSATHKSINSRAIKENIVGEFDRFSNNMRRH